MSNDTSVFPVALLENATKLPCSAFWNAAAKSAQSQKARAANQHLRSRESRQRDLFRCAHVLAKMMTDFEINSLRTGL
jgi:hypothetical protein